MSSAKRCLGCGSTKPLDAFYKARLGRQGRWSRCKDCMKPHYRAYYDENKERINANATAYQKAMSIEQKKKKSATFRRWNETSPVGPLGKNLRRALYRTPTENPVTVNDLLQIFSDQKGLCAVSGIEMTWGSGNFTATSMSIDRIDSSVGYTKENVRLVCYQVNTFKGVWTDVDMIAMARAIVAKADAGNAEPTWRPHLIHSEAA